MSEEEVNKIIEVYDSVIADLKQENIQLKEELKDENNYHEEASKWYKEAFDTTQENIKLKSVLKEIREYIKHEWFKRTQLGIIDKSFQEWQLIKVLEIIDKGLEEDK